MATDTREQCQDLCRILVLTDEEGKGMGTGTTNAQIGSQLEGMALVDGSVTSHSHSHKTVDHMEVSDPFPPCVVTVDIEQGANDVSKMTKPLRMQNSLQTGGESIQPFMNHILMLLKFDGKEKQGLERAHDGVNNNRWRKCKRPSLFDSRRIVILFSILSSMGTLVLIYLTLRVRQVSDGYIHG